MYVYIYVRIYACKYIYMCLTTDEINLLKSAQVYLKKKSGRGDCGEG